MRQDKAALAELWEFLELPDQMPDMSLWLMDFGKDMIESAFSAMKRRLEAGTKIQSPKNYLFTILDNAKLADMTPEERKDQISQIRSLAGTLGARKKHQNVRN